MKNSTTADFYVVTFNDADWTYSSYFGVSWVWLFQLSNSQKLQIYRVPAGQSLQVEAGESEKIKIGVVYYIPTDFEIVTGFNSGDYDMWRVQRETDIEVSFIGDKRGAGLTEVWWTRHFLHVGTFKL